MEVDLGVSHRKMHDPSIYLEEYMYYAKIQREQERQGLSPDERGNIAVGQATSQSMSGSGDEKTGEKASAVIAPATAPLVSPSEWENAS
jgi:hypothetical protein